MTEGMEAERHRANETAIPGMIVRRVRATDLPELVRLAETAATAAHWPLSIYQDYCDASRDEQTLQAKGLFVACAAKQPAISTTEIVGFSAMQVVLVSGECELQNIVVAAAWRRVGIGQRLLAAGMLWCKTWRRESKEAEELGLRLYLEVRASNTVAIAFYRGTGFVEAGRRLAYYTQPSEDAIVMERKFPVRA